MPDHTYEKQDLIQRFDNILGKKLEDIDNLGIFDHVQDFRLQKGVAGTIIEQCVLGYSPDSKQEADLIVIDGAKRTKTELKTTGMVIDEDHFVAKEPMSITAAGIYDLAGQEFYSSHFWEKLEHMLIVYYHYDSCHPVTPFEYKHFPVVGYEFHTFSEAETETLRADWEHVRTLVERVVSHHPGVHDAAWKNAVKEEYIREHGKLRRLLSCIDLAPKFPPRFRLKKPAVSAMISRHFGYALEQLPGRYITVSDIDVKCKELTSIYAGRTIGEIAKEFGIEVLSKKGRDKKAIAEQIIISMFGGKSPKLNQIEDFQKFGIIAKSVAMTSSGGRTEDMKLFHVDFDEFTRTEVEAEDGSMRAVEFEDSELYSYFADHEFLCVLFEEPSSTFSEGANGAGNLADNIFFGFKRLTFSDRFIGTSVRDLWNDVRDKVMNGKLEDIIQRDADGTAKRIKADNSVSSAPNFMKSSQNEVFMRGSGQDSALIHKTECVNGIKMLPQYVWIKGTSIVDELLNLERI